MSESAYTGLSERARLYILGLGALIAVANLAAAWYFSLKTGEALALAKSDMDPFAEWLKAMGAATLQSDSRYDLGVRAMHLVALIKLIANKQSLVLACFGGAYALMAVGFALFVIGADGAFKVSAATADKAKLVFSGTAPGLLCFAIAGWLVVKGVEQRVSLELPPLHNVMATTSPGEAAAPCFAKDAIGRCYTEPALARQSSQGAG